MILIQNNDHELIIIGHSTDAEHKRNETTIKACAMVSALAQTLNYGLIYVCKDRKIHAVAKKGYFKLDKSNLSDNARMLVDVFMIGLDAAKNSYPEMIKFVQA